MNRTGRLEVLPDVGWLEPSPHLPWAKGLGAGVLLAESVPYLD